MFEFQSLIYIIPSVLIALVFHEIAHGLVSYLLGDPTPKLTKRLSINPLNHLDLVGTLCLIFFRFGWAKAVRVNPMYYKNKKLGMVLVALAGPFTNFIISFLAILLIGLIFKFNDYESNYLYLFLRFLAIINVGLGTFNLIPIPPLDGSKVLGALLPERINFKYMQYERYGIIALFIILSLNYLNGPLSYLQETIISGLVKIVNLIL